MTQYKIDINDSAKKIDRYWEFSVGSCHAYTALREDFRQQLTKCKKDLGFRYLRFHGIFNDDMSVLTKSMYDGHYEVSFANIDNIFDFLLSIGMKPFIELGFMPECLKTDNITIFHYKGNVTPPSDKNVWVWFIKTFVTHLIDRYGLAEVRTWFFEIWNEPNLGGDAGIAGARFWSGSMQDYFELFKITSLAIKEVDEFLPVGGPATSNNALIPETIAFCKQNNVPIDFISTHHYPTDIVLGYGVEDSQNFMTKLKTIDLNNPDSVKEIAAEYVTFKKDIWKNVDRGVLTDMTKRAVSEAEGLPVYYTEWSSLAGLETDGAFGASFIAKTILDNMGLVKGYSYWTFSDIFEEGPQKSAAFHGGYGLMTISGICKAPYRAFQLLHNLGDEMFTKTFNNDTLDIYGFKKQESNALQFLAVNHHSLLHDVKTQTANIKISGLGKKKSVTLEILRVDENNANALTAWNNMGKPEYLNESQKHYLMAASELARETAKVEVKNGAAEFSIDLPPMGTALITVCY